MKATVLIQWAIHLMAAQNKLTGTMMLM